MSVLNLVPVLPSSDLVRDVALWRALLGVEPSFVDGDRWAQFDLGPRRLALAGADRVSELPGLMLKVDDLEAEAAKLSALGLKVGPIEDGPHERRFVAASFDGAPIVLYAALSSS